METMLGIFSAFGLSASAGLNAYIPLLVIALAARFTDLIKLNAPWDILTNGWIIGVLVFLTLVEFLVDKIPIIDHVNDAVQTFVRPTAGAIAFAASANLITDVNPTLSLALGLLAAGSIHAAKSVAIRPAVSVVTGGIGDAPASFAEDATATTVSVAAIAAPALAAGLTIALIAFLVWLIWLRPVKRRD